MPDALTVGSLFAGVGGFDLGLERAGMRVVWQAEQDEFCQRVLAKHWPGVPCHPDVRALVADTDGERLGLQRNGASQGFHRLCGAGGQGTEVVPVPVPYVDVIAGGFPCQDLSYAGKGAGIDGARSGLWAEFARLIRELRPRYVIVENVPALRSRGLHRVLGDLATCGFDAEWDCIPARAVGAPHRRDRIWIVAYPQGTGREALQRDGLRAFEGPGQGPVAHPPCEGGVGDPDGVAGAAPGARDGQPGALAQPGPLERTVGPGGGQGDHWLVEPDVGRVAHGVSARVDRLRALGNALVPQIAEWLGRRIVAYEGAQHG